MTKDRHIKALKLIANRTEPLDRLNVIRGRIACQLPYDIEGWAPDDRDLYACWLEGQEIEAQWDRSRALLPTTTERKAA